MTTVTIPHTLKVGDVFSINNCKNEECVIEIKKETTRAEMKKTFEDWAKKHGVEVIFILE